MFDSTLNIEKKEETPIIINDGQKKISKKKTYRAVVSKKSKGYNSKKLNIKDLKSLKTNIDLINKIILEVPESSIQKRLTNIARTIEKIANKLDESEEYERNLNDLETRKTFCELLYKFCKARNNADLNDVKKSMLQQWETINQIGSIDRREKILSSLKKIGLTNETVNNPQELFTTRFNFKGIIEGEIKSISHQMSHIKQHIRQLENIQDIEENIRVKAAKLFQEYAVSF